MQDRTPLAARILAEYLAGSMGITPGDAIAEFVYRAERGEGFEAELPDALGIVNVIEDDGTLIVTQTTLNGIVEDEARLNGENAERNARMIVAAHFDAALATV